MALHLNFFHEIRQQEKQRARDPRKLVGLAAAVVALIMVGYYLSRSNTVSSLNQEMARMQGEWRDLEPKQKKAKSDAVELERERKRNAAITTGVEGRFYWAPLLEQVAALVPPTVQVRSLAGDYAPPGSVDKPAVDVRISGLAAGNNARAAADAFRTRLRDGLEGRYPGLTVNFDANSLEETGDTVTHEGQTLHVARFRIRLSFNPPPLADTADASQKP